MSPTGEKCIDKVTAEATSFSASLIALKVLLAWTLLSVTYFYYSCSRSIQGLAIIRPSSDSSLQQKLFFHLKGKVRLVW